MRKKFRIESLPNPISTHDACKKNYEDNVFKNDIDFNDVKLENIKFVKVNYQPAVNEHLTPKIYVDNAIDESSLVRNNQDYGFNGHNLTNINSITLNKQAVNDNQVITKTYVDQFHREEEQSRRDLGINFYYELNDLIENDQDNDFNDKKFTKKYIDYKLDKNTIVRFNQTLENYLKVSVGNDTYNLTKYKKIQTIDKTTMKAGNTGGYHLP